MMDEHHCRGVSPQKFEQFEQTGVAVYRNVVEQDAIDEFQSLASLCVSTAAQKMEVEYEIVQRLTSAWSVRNKFVKAIADKAAETLSCVAQCVSEISEPYLDASLFVKTAQNGNSTHAHQDISYKWNQPVESRYAITTWLALDSCGPKRGGLSFGHAFDARAVAERQDFLASDFVDAASTTNWKAKEVCVHANPGDVIVFDSRLWHAADCFQGKGARRALAMRWASQSKWEQSFSILSPLDTPEVFGMDTSGMLLVRAIKNAFPFFPGSIDRKEVLPFVRWINEEISNERIALTDKSHQALADLEIALRLLFEHHGRPNEDVWLQVRDVVIPELLHLKNI